MITNQYASNSIVPAIDMANKMPRDGERNRAILVIIVGPAKKVLWL
jgi:hypothetical protein